MSNLKVTLGQKEYFPFIKEAIAYEEENQIII